MISAWKKPVEVFISTIWKKFKVPSWRLYSYTVCPLPAPCNYPVSILCHPYLTLPKLPMSPASCAFISSLCCDPLPAESITGFLSIASLAAPGCTSLSWRPFIFHSFSSHNLCLGHPGPFAVPYTCSAFLNLSPLSLLSSLECPPYSRFPSRSFTEHLKEFTTLKSLDSSEMGALKCCSLCLPWQAHVSKSGRIWCAGTQHCHGPSHPHLHLVTRLHLNPKNQRPAALLRSARCPPHALCLSPSCFRVPLWVELCFALGKTYSWRHSSPRIMLLNFNLVACALFPADRFSEGCCLPESLTITCFWSSLWQPAGTPQHPMLCLQSSRCCPGLLPVNTCQTLWTCWTSISTYSPVKALHDSHRVVSETELLPWLYLKQKTSSWSLPMSRQLEIISLSSELQPYTPYSILMGLPTLYLKELSMWDLPPYHVARSLMARATSSTVVKHLAKMWWTELYLAMCLYYFVRLIFFKFFLI